MSHVCPRFVLCSLLLRYDSVRFGAEPLSFWQHCILRDDTYNNHERDDEGEKDKSKESTLTIEKLQEAIRKRGLTEVLADKKIKIVRTFAKVCIHNFCFLLASCDDFGLLCRFS